MRKKTPSLLVPDPGPFSTPPSTEFPPRSVEAQSGVAPSRGDSALIQPATDLFERLARDPSVSVEKVERLMALWEREQARKAKIAFHTAMSSAQQEMRRVAPDSENTQTHSRYPSYAAMDRALRPIYTKYGFDLSFNTAEATVPEFIRVCCDVTHLGGHTRAHHIDIPADGKGAKGGDVMTKTHAVVSGVSYGMRALVKMIFNVAIGEDDDDGNAAGGVPAQQGPQAPKGYDEWVIDLEACAPEGWQKLSAAFNHGKLEWRTHLTRHNPQLWQRLKAKAQQVKGVSS